MCAPRGTSSRSRSPRDRSATSSASRSPARTSCRSSGTRRARKRTAPGPGPSTSCPRTSRRGTRRRFSPGTSPSSGAAGPRSSCSRLGPRMSRRPPPYCTAMRSIGSAVRTCRSSTRAASTRSPRTTPRSSSARDESRALDREPAGSILNTRPRYERFPPEDVHGADPHEAQGEERLQAAVPHGEPRMGHDGAGGGRGDHRPAERGGRVDVRDRRPPARLVRRPERAPRHGQEDYGHPEGEGREDRDPRGPREPDEARGRAPDAPQGPQEGPEQQARPAAHRVEDPPTLEVLQGGGRPPRGLGLLAQTRGAPGQVGGPMAARLEDLAPEALLGRARKAADLVDAAGRVRVFCHYDPDGTTSAAILARALLRRGKRFQATMSHAFDREALARLQGEENELLLVSDMGSGQLALLEALKGPTVALDHHKPLRGSGSIVHVNPHLVGIDGTREMCGSTTTWLLALALDEANWDLAGIAMAGAIGDKQDQGGFVGVNAALFREAVERKILVPERRLALRDVPLTKALATS